MLLADTSSYAPAVRRGVRLLLLIIAYILMSWIRLPYRLGSAGSSGFSTTSSTRISGCFAASYPGSGGSTSLRSSPIVALDIVQCVVVN